MCAWGEVWSSSTDWWCECVCGLEMAGTSGRFSWEPSSDELPEAAAAACSAVLRWARARIQRMKT